MKIHEMMALIGQFGYIYCKGGGRMRTRVEIMDVKPGRFGRTLVLIVPVEGLGADWRDIKKLSCVTNVR